MNGNSGGVNGVHVVGVNGVVPAFTPPSEPVVTPVALAGDMGRYGEIWGDMGRCGMSESVVTPASP